jgi:hypothetical protein
MNLIVRIRGVLLEALKSNKNLLLLTLFLLFSLLVIQLLQLTLIYKVLSQCQDFSMNALFFDNTIRESINSFLKSYDLRLENVKKLEEQSSSSMLNLTEKLKSLFGWVAALEIYAKTILGVGAVIVLIEICSPDIVMTALNGLYTTWRYVSDPVIYSCGSLFGVLGYVPKATYRLSAAAFRTCRDVIQSSFYSTVSSQDAPIVDSVGSAQPIESRSLFSSSPEGRLPPPVSCPTPTIGVGAASSGAVENFEITDDVSDFAQNFRDAFSSDAAKKVAETIGESV